MRVLSLAALLAALSTPALAAADLSRTTDGYNYFNKPGADVAQHDADIRDCRQQARPLWQPDTSPAVGGGGLIGLAVILAIKAGQAAVRNHTGMMVNIENCMVVKGWRVVVLDKDEGAKLAELDGKAKAAAIKDWIGAETPHGTVARAYANDALFRGTVIYTPARHEAQTSLSTDAVVREAPPKAGTGAAKDAPKDADAAEPPHETLRPPKPLSPEGLAGVPVGSAIILVNLKGEGGVSLLFERTDVDPAKPAAADARPVVIVVGQPFRRHASKAKVTGTTVAFAVSPGRWRLANSTAGLFALSYCLGSPGFDVAAGEVVYAGAFDPDAPTLAPDMTLEPAKAIFPAMSTLGDTVKAAAYVNGTTGACRGAYLYSLELPGVDFVNSYRNGSRAPGAAKTAATPPAAPSAPATPAQTSN